MLLKKVLMHRLAVKKQFTFDHTISRQIYYSFLLTLLQPFHKQRKKNSCTKNDRQVGFYGFELFLLQCPIYHLMQILFSPTGTPVFVRKDGLFETAIGKAIVYIKELFEQHTFVLVIPTKQQGKFKSEELNF
jgi:hypothetical protein